LRLAPLILVVFVLARPGVVTLAAQTTQAGYLQYGTKKMEARPFLVIQEEDYNEMAEIFGDWVRERMM